MERFQVAYLPFAPVCNMTFGGIKLTPYSVVRGRLTTDQKEYLDWYFNKYVDEQLKPLNTITVVHDEDNLLGPWDESSIQKFYDIVASLSFLSLWRNNPMTPLAHDNFVLYIKNFSTTDRSLALSSGGYIKKTTGYSREVSERMYFMRPLITPSSNLSREPWLIDEELFKAFSRSFIEKYNEQWFIKIIRSIRIFNSAYRNDEFINIFDRLMLLVVAFQTMCVEGEHSKKKVAQAIYQKVGFPQYGDSFEINKKLFDLMSKLYEIRSRYSHGQNLDPSIVIDPDFGDLFKTGTYLFGLTIKAILREIGLVQDTEEHRMVSEFFWGLFYEGIKDEEDV